MFWGSFPFQEKQGIKIFFYFLKSWADIFFNNFFLAISTNISINF